MNALRRFLALGAADADRRFAASMAHPSLDAADRYLRQSTIVTLIDRITATIHDWWMTSDTQRAASEAGHVVAGRDWRDRYHAIAMALFAAVAVHVALTLMQGAKAGWFWTVIPSMAAACAAVLLAAAARSKR